MGGWVCILTEISQKWVKKWVKNGCLARNSCAHGEPKMGPPCRTVPAKTSKKKSQNSTQSYNYRGYVIPTKNNVVLYSDEHDASIVSLMTRQANNKVERMPLAAGLSAFEVEHGGKLMQVAVCSALLSHTTKRTAWVFLAWSYKTKAGYGRR